MNETTHETARRRNLHFETAVNHYIAPILAAFGFRLKSTTPYAMEFGSSNETVNIYHDRLSFEIYLMFSLKDDSAPGISLRDIIERLGKNVASFFQASSAESVDVVIEKIALLLSCYAPAILSGDKLEFCAVQQYAANRDRLGTRKTIEAPVREEAEQAWRRQDYATVLALYSSLKGDLSEVELARLRYSRKYAK